MFPYLVFAYKTNVAANGGINDLLCVLTYPDNRIATESWIADVEALVDDFRTYNQFQLVRVNMSSVNELELFNSAAME